MSLLQELLLLAGGAVALWLFSLLRRDTSLVDIAWGPAFAVLGWAHALALGTQGAGRLALGLVTLWAARLALHIGARHRGEDPRYGRWRLAHGSSWWWRSLFTVFALQAALVWLLARPLVEGIRAPASHPGVVAVGTLVALAGLVWETVADRQLSRFRASGRPGPCDRGLWAYSRHPNYFGEAVFWWGIYLLALAGGAGWTVFAPLGLTLLLRYGSGVPLLERTLADKPGWAEYARRTSPFLPRRPRP